MLPPGVPWLTFNMLYHNRDEIKMLLTDEAMQDHSEHEHASVAQVARRRGTHERRPSFVARSQRLVYLTSKVDRFTPSCWWIGPVQLVLRLAMTSMMVLVKQQSVQCALASSIAIIGFILHRELMPMRRPSE